MKGFKPNEEIYLKNGCDIVNAIIESADISTEDGPTVNVTLKLPCGGVVFGGVCFGTEMLTNNGRDSYIEGWDKGMTAILRIMQLTEVKHWGNLVGKPLRAVLKDGMIVAIGHLLYDQFMDYKKPPFKEAK
jgi:hypothetical protein